MKVKANFIYLIIIAFLIALLIIGHQINKQNSASKKNEIFGKFRQGGLSSRIKYLDFLKENNNIRINNGQNPLFVYIIFVLRLLRNFKNLFK